MEAFTSKVSQNHLKQDEQEKPRTAHKQPIICTLPRENGWLSSDDLSLYQYQDFWYYPYSLEKILNDPELSSWNLSPSDILLCSNPKSGTTWLKALAFAIVTRNRHQNHDSNPLLTSLPHDLMPCLEIHNPTQYHSACDLELPLFSTHIPFTSLPKSILDSDIKIIYICRNPKDAFISRWHFSHKARPNKDSTEPIPLHQAFELFCRGISPFGPYWDHILGYWKASLDCPDKVYFLTYEAMMRDPVPHVICLANFMGYPFSKEEEMDGVPMKIVEICSFGNLSNLEVNKSGTIIASVLGFTRTFTNESFFRKGKVGDWRNYLTQEMADKIDQITEQKLGPFGLQL